MSSTDGYLRIEHVTKAYGDAPAVRDFSLRASRGELISLLGPSGCGKTTTLRMIAGFLAPDMGEIYIDGQPVSGVPSHKRETAIVFQNYALFPHMTVLANVEFGLRMRRVPKAERRERATEALGLVRLPAETYERLPGELSGGQQQRVALARALVVQPKLLLLDEPLSNLDAKLRKQLRHELREIHDRVGTTTVFVTHDLEEAFELSDRIAVMNGGAIEQLAAPMDLYADPATPFVADFVGHENMFSGKTTAGESGPEFHVDGTGLSFGLPAGAPDDTTAVVIPEARLRVSRSPVEADNTFDARLVRSSYRGRVTYLVLEENDSRQRLETHVVDDSLQGLPAGTDLHLGWNADDAVLLSGQR
jgi:putative spermidine/putrescine transport system ATP-binding protein